MSNDVATMLIAQVADNCTAVKAFVESSGSVGLSLIERKKEEKKNILSDKTSEENAAKVMEAVATSLWDTLQDHPNLAVFLAESLPEFVRDVRDYAEYICEEAARKNRPAIPADKMQAVTDAKNAAEQARKGFEFLLTLGVDIPDTIPTKRSKTGKLLLAIPKIHGEASTGAGRTVVSRHLSYFVDGEEIPRGTTLRTVAAKYMSDGANRTKYRDLVAAIKTATKGSDLEFSVTLNGHTFEGKDLDKDNADTSVEETAGE